MKKILIYDDETAYRETLREKLTKRSVVTSQFEIETMGNDDFKATIDTLRNRQKQLRKDGTWDDEEIPLDSASIFIVDYDLVKNEVDSFLTGENIAYTARCFSKCGLIIALNQFDIDFDLTLRGHPESFADLNIRGEHLGNTNLWGDKNSTENFYPWYWPSLPKFQEDYEKRIEDVKKEINNPICKALGFDPELFDILPRSITQFIGQEPSSTSFREFVQKSGNGMREKDAENVNDEALIARISAARLSKWLERQVLPELDILVDAPHLVARYPSLIKESEKDIDTWNRTTQRARHTELGLDIEKIEDARLQKDFWLSRPVWFWNNVRENEQIQEVKEPWVTQRPDWVFCEDISKFYDGDVQEFVAEVESPFARRFVRLIEGIDYQPRVRLAF